MTPTKNEWEERFDKACDDAAYFNDGLLDASSRSSLKAFIRAEKEKSEAETLKKVLEVVEGMKPRENETNWHQSYNEGQIDFANNLTDKLTHITKE